MQEKMNYYYNSQNNSDYPYDLYDKSSSKNNTENKNLNNQGDIDINTSQEEINSKEDKIKINNYDEIENSGHGKFRFINTQAEREDKIKNKNNYPTKGINNKENNNSNKITNNICIIINKPEIKDINNNNNINTEYSNNFEEDKNKNLNKKELNDKFNSHKKNKSYASNNSKSNKKSINEYIEEIDNYNAYSYIDTEPNEEGKKITLHKKLKQKKQELKDLEENIKLKNISLKDKKSKFNKKGKTHVKSTSFEWGNHNHNKNNDLKGESITYDSSEYNSIEKIMPNIKNKNNVNNINNINNYNDNLKNKFINSDNQIFNDIPMIKIQKQKYYDDEEYNNYKTMSPDITRDKFNASFNKSIEQKRKLLGIPLYKNDFPKYNVKIRGDMDKEEKEKLNKLAMYQKRQDEILKNYEKKNIINQKSRDYIKNSKNKNKNPIRITYYDKYKKDTNPNNIFENDNYINENNNKIHNDNKKNKNGVRLNNSYVVKKQDVKNKNKRNYNSQREIPNYHKQNKTQNSLNHKIEETNYLKKKIKIYKQKEKKEKEENKNKNKNFFEKDKKENNNNINKKELIELKQVPSNKVDVPFEKKIYDNYSYYSKIISKLFNYNINESKNNSNSNKVSNNNSNNKNINNLYNNAKYNNKKNNNIKINNYKDKSPYKTNIYSSPKHDEVMTIQNNENGKILRIVKKRHKSPKKITTPLQTNQKYQNQNLFIDLKKVEKEKETPQKKIEKKEIKNNNIIAPGRGISALRRINQRIENYKKRIPSKKRRKNKNKNQQYKSFSQLKKIGKHPFGRIKQSKSIKTLPDVNNEAYQNFDFINDI